MIGMSLSARPEIKLELHPKPRKISVSVSGGLRSAIEKNGHQLAAAYRAALEAFGRVVAFGTNHGDPGTSNPLTADPLERLTRAYYCEGNDIRRMFAEASRVEAVMSAAPGGVGLEVRMFRTKEKTAFTGIRLVFGLDGSCAGASYYG